MQDLILYLTFKALMQTCGPKNFPSLHIVWGALSCDSLSNSVLTLTILQLWFCFYFNLCFSPLSLSVGMTVCSNWSRSLSLYPLYNFLESSRNFLEFSCDSLEFSQIFKSCHPAVKRQLFQDHSRTQQFSESGE